MNPPRPPAAPASASPTTGLDLLGQIRRWYACGRWANERMLAACETLHAEALASDQRSSFRSVLGTLEHMYGADWIWLERWLGRSPTSFPAQDTLKTVADFRDAWAALDARREEFLRTLTPGRLAERLAYRNLKGDAFEDRLGDLLLHVANHSTYHRGQVMQFVRQLGGTVTSTDFSLWLHEAE